MELFKEKVCTSFVFWGTVVGFCFMGLYISESNPQERVSAFFSGGFWAFIGFMVITCLKFNENGPEEDPLGICITRGVKTGLGIYIPHVFYGFYEYVLMRP